MNVSLQFVAPFQAKQDQILQLFIHLDICTSQHQDKKITDLRQFFQNSVTFCFDMRLKKHNKAKQLSYPNKLDDLVQTIHRAVPTSKSTLAIVIDKVQQYFAQSCPSTEKKLQRKN